MKNPLPLLLALASTALANDTALHDGRFGPEPLDATNGAESAVRMEREHLEISFGAQFTEVHCTFTFRNTRPDGAIEHLVGFPDIGAACDEMKRREPTHADTLNERVNTSRLTNVRTFVNGRKAGTELRFGDVKPGGDTDGTTVWSFDDQSGVRAWHVVRVTFTAQKEVTVERRYRVQNGTSALGVAFFDYTTATGGVWQGSIGRLQADITLRDGLTVGGLVWPGAKMAGGQLIGDEEKFATHPARDAWQVLDETHVRLVWNDFEPRAQKDRRGFSLSRPFHGW